MGLFLDYNANVPNGPDDPADDQPEMLTNTQSINTWTAVDHVGYNVINAGIHKQVRMRNQAAPGLGDGQGVLYANLINANSWPVWQNALGSFPIMTGAIQLTTNGFIFIPGGALLQWGFNSAVLSGSFASGAATGTVTFSAANVAFPTNCLNVLTIPSYTTVSGNPNGSGSVDINQTTLSGTSFDWVFNSNSSRYTGFYWIAIGF